MRYEIIEHDNKESFKKVLNTTLATYEDSRVAHFSTKVVHRISEIDGADNETIAYIAIVEIPEYEY